MIDNIISQVFISTNLIFLLQGHEFIVPKMPKTVDAVIQTTEEAPDDGQAMEGDGYEEGSSAKIDSCCFLVGETSKLKIGEIIQFDEHIFQMG